MYGWRVKWHARALAYNSFAFVCLLSPCEQRIEKMVAPQKQEEKKAEEAPAAKKEEALELEEDDWMEDFEAEGAEPAQEEAALPLWEADWEDDEVGPDFSIQLKQELGIK